MTDYELREQLTGPQYLALTHYFGSLVEYEYTEKDEKLAQKLMKGIHPSFYPSLLYLLKFHSDFVFNNARYSHALEPYTKEFEKIRKEINKMSDTPVKEKLLAALPPLDQISITGRPKNLDTYVIERFSPFASYIWFYNLIPGKRNKPSKEMVYPFMYNFIKACGHTFSVDECRAIKMMKDYLKTDLKEMDAQKF